MCRATRRLAQALLHRNEARLQPSLQRFLTAVMDGQPTESELQEDYHHLIYQVHSHPKPRDGAQAPFVTTVVNARAP